jgi:hypothetical protein
LAVSREGRPPQARLRNLKLKSGDLVLMQGPAEMIAEFIKDTGCVPLGERELRIPDKRMAVISGAIMLGTIIIVTLGLLPAPVGFALGVLASMLLRTVPLRQIYTSIDWPIIVLLAALIPVAGAMQTTGAVDQLARFLVDTIAQGNPIAALAVVLITTLVSVRRDEQRCYCGHPHPHRASEQHVDPWPWRVPVRRLLAVGSAGRGLGGRRQHAAFVDRLAVVKLTGQSSHCPAPAISSGFDRSARVLE